jgi:hypothetical protein
LDDALAANRRHLKMNKIIVPSQGPSARGAWTCVALAIGAILGAALTLDLQSTLLAVGGTVPVLLVLSFWAMPKTGTAPENLVWHLLLFYLFALIVWPSYISIHISGLPWISIARVCLFAVALLWIYSIFHSGPLKDRILGAFAVSPVWLYCVCGLVFSQFASLALSGDIALSVSKFILWQVSWTLVLFIAVSLTTDLKRLTQIYSLLAIAALIEIGLVFLEIHNQRIIWLDWLPPGFAADEYLQRIITAKYRADVYRPQGSFTLNLMYAEFVAIVFPFAIFLFLHAQRYWVRALGALAAVMSLPGVYVSEARSGNIALIVALFGWGILFALRRWQKDRLSVAGPLLLGLYVVGAVLFAGVAENSRRFQGLTIGRTANHDASTEARKIQWRMGTPKVMARPLFGYGVGRSADVLGYSGGSGILTIDTYPLTLLLEVGVIGFMCFFGLFGWAIFTGFRLYLYGASPSSLAGGPIAISLMAFLTIKLVLSQPDNHSLIFLLVGLVVGLARLEQTYSNVPRSRWNERRWPAAIVRTEKSVGV